MLKLFHKKLCSSTVYIFQLLYSRNEGALAFLDYVVQALHQLGGGRRGGARGRPVQGIQGGQASGNGKNAISQLFLIILAYIFAEYFVSLVSTGTLLFLKVSLYRACKSRANNINNNIFHFSPWQYRQKTPKIDTASARTRKGSILLISSSQNQVWIELIFWGIAFFV